MKINSCLLIGLICYVDAWIWPQENCASEGYRCLSSTTYTFCGYRRSDTQLDHNIATCPPHHICDIKAGYPCVIDVRNLKNIESSHKICNKQECQTRICSPESCPDRNKYKQECTKEECENGECSPTFCVKYKSTSGNPCNCKHNDNNCLSKCSELSPHIRRTRNACGCDTNGNNCVWDCNKTNLTCSKSECELGFCSPEYCKKYIVDSLTPCHCKPHDILCKTRCPGTNVIICNRKNCLAGKCPSEYCVESSTASPVTPDETSSESTEIPNHSNSCNCEPEDTSCLENCVNRPPACYCSPHDIKCKLRCNGIGVIICNKKNCLAGKCPSKYCEGSSFEIPETPDGSNFCDCEAEDTSCMENCTNSTPICYCRPHDIKCKLRCNGIGVIICTKKNCLAGKCPSNYCDETSSESPEIPDNANFCNCEPGDTSCLENCSNTPPSCYCRPHDIKCRLRCRGIGIIICNKKNCLAGRCPSNYCDETSSESPEIPDNSKFCNCEPGDTTCLENCSNTPHYCYCRPHDIKCRLRCRGIGVIICNKKNCLAGRCPSNYCDETSSESPEIPDNSSFCNCEPGDTTCLENCSITPQYCYCRPHDIKCRLRCRGIGIIICNKKNCLAGRCPSNYCDETSSESPEIPDNANFCNCEPGDISCLENCSNTPPSCYCRPHDIKCRLRCRGIGIIICNKKNCLAGRCPSNYCDETSSESPEIPDNSKFCNCEPGDTTCLENCSNTPHYCYCRPHDIKCRLRCRGIGVIICTKKNCLAGRCPSNYCDETSSESPEIPDNSSFCNCEPGDTTCLENCSNTPPSCYCRPHDIKCRLRCRGIGIIICNKKNCLAGRCPSNYCDETSSESPEIPDNSKFCNCEPGDTTCLENCSTTPHYCYCRPHDIKCRLRCRGIGVIICTKKNCLAGRCPSNYCDETSSESPEIPDNSSFCNCEPGDTTCLENCSNTPPSCYCRPHDIKCRLRCRGIGIIICNKKNCLAGRCPSNYCDETSSESPEIPDNSSFCNCEPGDTTCLENCSSTPHYCYCRPHDIKCRLRCRGIGIIICNKKNCLAGRCPSNYCDETSSESPEIPDNTNFCNCEPGDTSCLENCSNTPPYCYCRPHDIKCRLRCRGIGIIICNKKNCLAGRCPSNYCDETSSESPEIPDNANFCNCEPGDTTCLENCSNTPPYCYCRPHDIKCRLRCRGIGIIICNKKNCLAGRCPSNYCDETSSESPEIPDNANFCNCEPGDTTCLENCSNTPHYCYCRPHDIKCRLRCRGIGVIICTKKNCLAGRCPSNYCDETSSESPEIPDNSKFCNCEPGDTTCLENCSNTPHYCYCRPHDIKCRLRCRGIGVIICTKKNCLAGRCPSNYCDETSSESPEIPDNSSFCNCEPGDTTCLENCSNTPHYCYCRPHDIKCRLRCRGIGIIICNKKNCLAGRCPSNYCDETSSESPEIPDNSSFCNCEPGDTTCLENCSNTPHYCYCRPHDIKCRLRCRGIGIIICNKKNCLAGRCPSNYCDETSSESPEIPDNANFCNCEPGDISCLENCSNTPHYCYCRPHDIKCRLRCRGIGVIICNKKNCLAGRCPSNYCDETSSESPEIPDNSKFCNCEPGDTTCLENCSNTPHYCYCRPHDIKCRLRCRGIGVIICTKKNCLAGRCPSNYCDETSSESPEIPDNSSFCNCEPGDTTCLENCSNTPHYCYCRPHDIKCRLRCRGIGIIICNKKNCLAGRCPSNYCDETSSESPEIPDNSSFCNCEPGDTTCLENCSNTPHYCYCRPHDIKCRLRCRGIGIIICNKKNCLAGRCPSNYCDETSSESPEIPDNANFCNCEPGDISCLENCSNTPHYCYCRPHDIKCRLRCRGIGVIICNKKNCLAGRCPSNYCDETSSESPEIPDNSSFCNCEPGDTTCLENCSITPQYCYCRPHDIKCRLRCRGIGIIICNKKNCLAGRCPSNYCDETSSESPEIPDNANFCNCEPGDISCLENCSNTPPSCYCRPHDIKCRLRCRGIGIIICNKKNCLAGRCPSNYCDETSSESPEIPDNSKFCNCEPGDTTCLENCSNTPHYCYCRPHDIKCRLRCRGIGVIICTKKNCLAGRCPSNYCDETSSESPEIPDNSSFCNCEPGDTTCLENCSNTPPSCYCRPHDIKCRLRCRGIGIIICNKKNCLAGRCPSNYCDETSSESPEIPDNSKFCNCEPGDTTCLENCSTTPHYCYCRPHDIKCRLRCRGIGVIICTKKNCLAGRCPSNYCDETSSESPEIPDNANFCNCEPGDISCLENCSNTPPSCYCRPHDIKCRLRCRGIGIIICNKKNCLAGRCPSNYCDETSSESPEIPDNSKFCNCEPGDTTCLENCSNTPHYCYCRPHDIKCRLRCRGIGVIICTKKNCLAGRCPSNYCDETSSESPEIPDNSSFCNCEPGDTTCLENCSNTPPSCYCRPHDIKCRLRCRGIGIIICNKKNCLAGRCPSNYCDETSSESPEIPDNSSFCNCEPGDTTCLENCSSTPHYCYCRPHDIKCRLRCRGIGIIICNKKNCLAGRCPSNYCDETSSESPEIPDNTNFCNCEPGDTSCLENCSNTPPYCYCRPHDIKCRLRCRGIGIIICNKKNCLAGRCPSNYCDETSSESPEIPDNANFCNCEPGDTTCLENCSNTPPYCYCRPHDIKCRLRCRGIGIIICNKKNCLAGRCPSNYCDETSSESPEIPDNANFCNCEPGDTTCLENCSNTPHYCYCRPHDIKCRLRCRGIGVIICTKKNCLAGRCPSNYCDETSSESPEIPDNANFCNCEPGDTSCLENCSNTPPYCYCRPHDIKCRLRCRGIGIIICNKKNCLSGRCPSNYCDETSSESPEIPDNANFCNCEPGDTTCLENCSNTPPYCYCRPHDIKCRLRCRGIGIIICNKKNCLAGRCPSNYCDETSSESPEIPDNANFCNCEPGDTTCLENCSNTPHYCYCRPHDIKCRLRCRGIGVIICTKKNCLAGRCPSNYCDETSSESPEIPDNSSFCNCEPGDTTCLENCSNTPPYCYCRPHDIKCRLRCRGIGVIICTRKNCLAGRCPSNYCDETSSESPEIPDNSSFCNCEPGDTTCLENCSNTPPYCYCRPHDIKCRLRCRGIGIIICNKNNCLAGRCPSNYCDETSSESPEIPDNSSFCNCEPGDTTCLENCSNTRPYCYCRPHDIKCRLRCRGIGVIICTMKNCLAGRCPSNYCDETSSESPEIPESVENLPVDSNSCSCEPEDMICLKNCSRQQSACYCRPHDIKCKMRCRGIDVIICTRKNCLAGKCPSNYCDETSSESPEIPDNSSFCNCEPGDTTCLENCSNTRPYCYCRPHDIKCRLRCRGIGVIICTRKNCLAGRCPSYYCEETSSESPEIPESVENLPVDSNSCSCELGDMNCLKNCSRQQSACYCRPHDIKCKMRCRGIDVIICTKKNCLAGKCPSKYCDELPSDSLENLVDPSSCSCDLGDINCMEKCTNPSPTCFCRPLDFKCRIRCSIKDVIICDWKNCLSRKCPLKYCEDSSSNSQEIPNYSFSCSCESGDTNCMEMCQSNKPPKFNPCDCNTDDFNCFKDCPIITPTIPHNCDCGINDLKCIKRCQQSTLLPIMTDICYCSPFDFKCLTRCKLYIMICTKEKCRTGICPREHCNNISNINSGAYPCSCDSEDQICLEKCSAILPPVDNPCNCKLNDFPCFHDCPIKPINPHPCGCLADDLKCIQDCQSITTNAHPCGCKPDDLNCIENCPIYVILPGRPSIEPDITKACFCHLHDVRCLIHCRTYVILCTKEKCQTGLCPNQYCDNNETPVATEMSIHINPCNCLPDDLKCFNDCPIKPINTHPCGCLPDDLKCIVDCFGPLPNNHPCGCQPQDFKCMKDCPIEVVAIEPDFPTSNNPCGCKPYDSSCIEKCLNIVTPPTVPSIITDICYCKPNDVKCLIECKLYVIICTKEKCRAGICPSEYCINIVNIDSGEAPSTNPCGCDAEDHSCLENCSEILPPVHNPCNCKPDDYLCFQDCPIKPINTHPCGCLPDDLKCIVDCFGPLPNNHPCGCQPQDLKCMKDCPIEVVAIEPDFPTSNNPCGCKPYDSSCIEKCLINVTPSTVPSVITDICYCKPNDVKCLIECDLYVIVCTKEKCQAGICPSEYCINIVNIDSGEAPSANPCGCDSEDHNCLENCSEILLPVHNPCSCKPDDYLCFQDCPIKPTNPHPCGCLADDLICIADCLGPIPNNHPCGCQPQDFKCMKDCPIKIITIIPDFCRCRSDDFNCIKNCKNPTWNNPCGCKPYDLSCIEKCSIITPSPTIPSVVTDIFSKEEQSCFCSSEEENCNCNNGCNHSTQSSIEFPEIDSSEEHESIEFPEKNSREEFCSCSSDEENCNCITGGYQSTQTPIVEVPDIDSSVEQSCSCSSEEVNCNCNNGDHHPTQSSIEFPEKNSREEQSCSCSSDEENCNCITGGYQSTQTPIVEVPDIDSSVEQSCSCSSEEVNCNCNNGDHHPTQSSIEFPEENSREQQSCSCSSDEENCNCNTGGYHSTQTTIVEVPEIDSSKEQSCSCSSEEVNCNCNNGDHHPTQSSIEFPEKNSREKQSCSCSSDEENCNCSTGGYHSTQTTIVEVPEIDSSVEQSCSCSSEEVNCSCNTGDYHSTQAPIAEVPEIDSIPEPSCTCSSEETDCQCQPGTEHTIHLNISSVTSACECSSEDKDCSCYTDNKYTTEAEPVESATCLCLGEDDCKCSSGYIHSTVSDESLCQCSSDDESCDCSIGNNNSVGHIQTTEDTIENSTCLCIGEENCKCSSGDIHTTDESTENEGSTGSIIILHPSYKEESGVETNAQFDSRGKYLGKDENLPEYTIHHPYRPSGRTPNCNIAKKGIRMPGPNCRSYYTCALKSILRVWKKSVLIIRKCPKGKYFSGQLLTCVKGKCVDSI